MEWNGTEWLHMFCPEFFVTGSGVGLRAPSRRAALGSAGPGPPSREGQRRAHTYKMAPTPGRGRRPQAEPRPLVPWALSRGRWGWGSRGRPAPAIEACEHLQDPGGSRPALLVCSPSDIWGWPLWRPSIGPEGPSLWWGTAALWVFCFTMFFQGKQLGYF